VDLSWLDLVHSIAVLLFTTILHLWMVRKERFGSLKYLLTLEVKFHIPLSA
jgi:hypothetical protein